MSEPPKIVDLNKVIEPHLDGGKLVSYQSRYLTKPGENYGSVILSLAANVKRPNGQIEELQLVVKLPPITNDLYWQVFQPERTCLTENAIYKYLQPAIRDLQLEAGVPEEELFSAFPAYYGSRISLDDAATVVDRDALLIQENLQTSGFRAGDRLKMYDFKHTKIVLENLAQFHALPIALRLKKPDIFDKYVRPYFQRFDVSAGISESEKKIMIEDLTTDLVIATNNNGEIIEKVLKIMVKGDEAKLHPVPADDIFISIEHGDLWINNIMIQYDENGSPSKLKFIDFQVSEIESVVHDIIFFLFSSVDSHVLEIHYDEFLRIYYDALLKSLQGVGVSTAEYSYEGFLEEVQRVASFQIGHALIMIRIILADKSSMPDDYKDMDMNVIRKSKGRTEITQKTADIIRLAQKFNIL